MIGAPLRGLAVTYIACHEFHSAAVCGRCLCVTGELLMFCLLTDNGELFTWGRAGPYLGYEVESGNKQMRPRRVSQLEEHRVSQAACGCAHTLGEPCNSLVLAIRSLPLSVCTEGNQVFSFGSNEFGELGLGHEHAVTSPSLVSFTEDPSIYRIACGRNHSAAIDGT